MAFKAASSRILFSGILVLLVAAGSLGTPLDDFVAAPDPNYAYSLVSVIPNAKYTAYVLDMTSQQWRTADEVDRPLWKHWLIIVIPTDVRTDLHSGILLIDGGSNGGSPPTTLEDEVALVASSTRMVMADLRMVPNEPLLFAGETETRTEDAIIAYSLDKYLTTSDPTWPVLLPMVKSAVRAMDTIQAFVPTVAPSVSIEKFVVTGGSKRGWTTWLTAAADPRVEMMIPIVFDALNLDLHVQHHWAAYGFWSSAIHDYADMHVFERMSTPEGQALLQIVDPYEYRARYASIPKLGINSTGDQFFLPDSAQFYFQDLPGEKYLLYVPNTDHSVEDPMSVLAAVRYLQAWIYGWWKPQFNWDLGRDGTYRLEAQDLPTHVYLWQATNPIARDFRLQTIGKVWTSAELTPVSEGVYEGKVSSPMSGWTAFFLELLYGPPQNYMYKMTTEVRVVPDCYPADNCTPEPTSTPTAPPTQLPTATPTQTPTPVPFPDKGWAEAGAGSRFSGLLLYGDRQAREMAGLPGLPRPAATHVLGHFHCSPQWYTGIALVNPSDTQSCQVTLNGYQGSGTGLATASLSLPPRAQLAKLLTDPSLFGPITSTGWLEVQSDQDCSAFLVYGDKVYGGIAALPGCELAGSLVLPHFHVSQQWWTGVSVVNPNASPIHLTLTAYANDGLWLDQIIRDIPAKGKLTGRVDELFSLGSSATGWIEAKAAGGLIGGLLVYGQSAACSRQIAAMTATSPQTHLGFSAFLSDANWWTGLVVVNPQDARATLSIEARSRDGSLMDSRAETLLGLSRLVGTVKGLFPLAGDRGWIRVQSDLPLCGAEILNGMDDANQAWGLAGIESQEASLGLLLPQVDIGPRWWTWFGFANPGPAELEPLIKAYRTDGAFAGAASTSIPAQGALLQDVRDLFGLSKGLTTSRTIGMDRPQPDGTLLGFGREAR